MLKKTKNEDILKKDNSNKNILKKEDDLINEDDLNKEDNLKNKDNPKNKDHLTFMTLSSVRSFKKIITSSFKTY